MAEVYRPDGWPEAVPPPGTEDWEAAAVTWLLEEFVPDLRTSPVRRYPPVLAAIARHTVAGSLEGARAGYRVARSELGEVVPPHAIDAALTAYRDEGRRLAKATKALELVELALRGEIA